MAAVIAEAMAKEFGVQVKNVVDDNGASHSDDNGQFDGGNGGAGVSPAQKAKAGDDLDEKVAKVTAERISEIASGKSKGLVSVEEGLAVVLSDPTFKDKFGRSMKFDSSLSAKYRFGQGRSMNERDLERFRRVQDAIYAVTHDEHPVITLNGKKIMETTDLPRGSQRCYRTATANGETWAISWADKVYVRSIQERSKNNPPYRE